MPVCVGVCEREGERERERERGGGGWEERERDLHDASKPFTCVSQQVIMQHWIQATPAKHKCMKVYSDSFKTLKKEARQTSSNCNTSLIYQQV